jgi:hypothetical protein
MTNIDNFVYDPVFRRLNALSMNPSSTFFSALVFLVLCATSPAENRTEQTPITMEQLMRELHIQGGNFQFTFDEPVFARVTTEVGDHSKAGASETEHFATVSANQSVSLFFSASALFVGDYQQPNVVFTNKMLIKLSDWPATEGTTIMHYVEKFTGNHAKYSPAVPAKPELGKPYILHWYFKDGDPYSAKAVIEFSATPFPK